MRSVSSVLAVKTKRSAKQFALGQRGWDLHGADPGVGENGVERVAELISSVTDEEPEGGGSVVEVHQQVAGLLGCPCSGRMARRSEDMHVAAANLESEEHVDPLQGDRAVDVEEVHGQHAGGLRPQKPAQDVSVARSGAVESGAA
jgi:hypothetical protein